MQEKATQDLSQDADFSLLLCKYVSDMQHYVIGQLCGRMPF